MQVCYNNTRVVSACMCAQHQACRYSTCLVASVCYFSTPLFTVYTHTHTRTHTHTHTQHQQLHTGVVSKWWMTVHICLVHHVCPSVYIRTYVRMYTLYSSSTLCTYLNCKMALVSIIYYSMELQLAHKASKVVHIIIALWRNTHVYMYVKL